MTAKPGIDPAEFLHGHLTQASPDLLRELMGGFINTLLPADADGVCSAPYGVRDEGRINRHNGYRHRELDTRIGTLDVAVPKLREGTYFPDWLLERRRRAEAALNSVVATCYLLGSRTDGWTGWCSPSAPSAPSRTTNGPTAATTEASTSSPRVDSS